MKDSSSFVAKKRLSVRCAAEALASIVETIVPREEDETRTSASLNNLSSTQKNDRWSSTASTSNAGTVKMKSNAGIDDKATLRPTSTFCYEKEYSKSFPEILMDVLSDEECAYIISWLPDGCAFKIHRPHLFESNVLPHYFQSSQYASFTRKLYRWGFRRLKLGDHSGAFFHPLFSRDDPDRSHLNEMKCQSRGQRKSELRKRGLGNERAWQKKKRKCAQEQIGSQLVLPSPATSALDLSKTRPNCQRQVHDTDNTCISRHLLPSLSDILFKQSLPTVMSSSLLKPPQLKAATLGTRLLPSLSMPKLALSRAALRAVNVSNTTRVPQLYLTRAPSKLSAKKLPICLFDAANIATPDYARDTLALQLEPFDFKSLRASRHQQLSQRTQETRALLQQSGLLIM